MSSGNIDFKTYASVADIPNASSSEHFRMGIVGTEIVGKDSAGNVYYFSNDLRPSANTTTTNATPTVAFSSPVLPEGSAMYIRVYVVGRVSNLSAAIGGYVEGVFRRASGGNIGLVDTTNSLLKEDSASAPTASLAANTGSQKADFSVTGVAAQTWTWYAWGEVRML